MLFTVKLHLLPYVGDNLMYDPLLQINGELYDHCLIISKEYNLMKAYEHLYELSKDWNIIQLVPIKTLQSLNAKCRTINESFETNFDCTVITKD